MKLRSISVLYQLGVTPNHHHENSKSSQKSSYICLTTSTTLITTLTLSSRPYHPHVAPNHQYSPLILTFLSLFPPLSLFLSSSVSPLLFLPPSPPLPPPLSLSLITRFCSLLFESCDRREDGGWRERSEAEMNDFRFVCPVHSRSRRERYFQKKWIQQYHLGL